MTLRALACVLAVGLACTACTRRQPDALPPPKATDAPPEKSSVSTAIDGFTGKTAVDQLQRAKITVRDVEARKKQQADEALVE